MVAICILVLILSKALKRNVKDYLLNIGFLFLILILSIVYATYKVFPFPSNYQKKMMADLRLISEPKVKAYTLTFTARLLRVYDGNKRIGSFSNERILLKLPLTKIQLKRGWVINLKGMFFDIDELKYATYTNYLKSNGIKAIFEGSSRDIHVLKRPNPFSIISIANSLRNYIKIVNERLLLYPQSEFARAIVSGNRDDIPYNIKESFRKSGTMHILAVSGLHVGFLVAIFISLFSSLRLKKNITYFLTILLIVFYAVFIGNTPSVKRASIMAICGIMVFLLDRDRDYINALAIGFIIIWITNPLVLFNPGFLMSFSATFGILFLTPRFYKLLLNISPKFLAGSLSASLAVQIYILPVMLYFFNGFAYINILANIPIVPLAGLSIALEVLYLILYPIFLPLSIIVSEVNLVVITLIIRIANFFSRTPMIEVGNFSFWIIPFYFAFITILMFLIFKKRDIDNNLAFDYQV